MVNMLVKCETKSNRVKGLAFHPTLPWVLSALHNGTIQLWDFQLGVLLDKFEDHEGPVRGMSFHPNQPLFVSGADDYKVKVWNYKQRRCLFTLQGHLDYIRTTVFHHEYPWILSASDDQTIRIWNWQSRQCIAVMTGHNHYVMSAQFHPKDDLVITASLDQTIRVWDVSGLKQKTVSSNKPPSLGPGSGGASSLSAAALANADLFGVNDAVVKFVLEGHDRGVNWAEFHPTLPLIVSASDDRTIKLWRMNDTKAWEIDTLRGHFNNVSCVTFHPRQDLIISDGEDKTIRVWDATKRQLLHTFKRENDRFWVIGCHKSSNTIAAGHDSGLVVFKLDKERPLASMAPGASSGYVYIVNRNRQLTAVNSDSLTTTTAQPSILIGSCRKQVSAMSSGYKSMCVNPFNSTEMNVLVTYDYDGGCYDIFTAPNQAVLRPSDKPTVDSKGGAGKSVAFIARNRFAVLAKDGMSVSIMSLHNELSKKVDLPFHVDAIFPGGQTNRLVLKTSEDKAILFDASNRQIVAELNVGGSFRQVVWSPSCEYVAFLNKHSIMIASGADLKFTQSVKETIRIKSGVWDDNEPAFVYTTSSHLKYILPYTTEGEKGMIQATNKVWYLLRVNKGQVVYADRELNVTRSKIFSHEYMFKLALIRGDSDQVINWLKSGPLLGSVTIGYLKKRGFPEVALHFVENMETRFNLALEYGHLDEAVTAAEVLKKPDVWNRLGSAAVQLGYIDVSEKSFIASQNLEQLQFLYLLSGNMAKLGKLSLKASKDRDHFSRFNLGLVRAEPEERIAVLNELGLTQLAKKTEDVFLHGHDTGAAALVPRPAINAHQSNWPITKSMAELFAARWAGIEAAAKAAAANVPPPASPDEQEDFEDAQDVLPSAAATVDVKAWGDDELDMELENVVLPVTVGGSAQAQTNVLAYGETKEKLWLAHRRLVPDLIAAGEVAEALSTLTKRIALVNPRPLEPMFREAVVASHVYVPGLPFTPSISAPVMSGASSHPFILFSPKFLEQKLGNVLVQTGVGNAVEALEAARYCMHGLCLSLADSTEDETLLNKILTTSREYAIAMLMESLRRDLSQDQSQKQRELELAAYLCCSKIESVHLLLVIGSAMNISFRAKNFVLASHFARRIITGVWGSDEVVAATTMRARKVLAASEEKGTDIMKINFDPAWLTSPEQLKLCCGSLTPIHASFYDKIVKCPFCHSQYHPEYAGTTCTICQLSSVGATALGLQFTNVLK